MATSLKIRFNINTSLKNLLKKKQYQQLANLAAKIIKTRTRLGFGVKANKKKKLKALKPATKKARRNFKGLSKKTTPETSNLTRTGQLLDALKGIGLNKSYKVQIKDGRRDKSKNSDIIKGQEDYGREFLELSGGEKQLMAKAAKEILLKEIKKRQKKA